jgi:chromosome segregation ATPase
MAIQQDIVLNFKANLDEAKQNVSQLASLYQQSLIPQGQPGALDDSQKQQVESLVGERAQAAGMNVEDTRAALQQLADMHSEIEVIQERTAKNQEKISELNEKAGQAAVNRKVQEQKVKELLGLSADATRDQVEAKLAELRIAKNLNISEADRIQKLEESEKLLRSAQAYGAASVRHNNAVLSLTEEQTNNLEQQDILAAQLTNLGQRLKLTTEEQEILEASIMGYAIKHTAAQKKNNQAKQEAVKLAEEEEQQLKDIDRLLEKQPDNFAKRAVSAVLYYEALNQLKRIARAAVNTIQELDRALTDIAVVTDMNRQES